MRLTRICLILSAIYLAVGLLAGAVVQGELAEPGIAFGAGPANTIHMIAVPVHAVVFGIAFPVSAVGALGAAIFAEARGQNWARMFAIVQLILSGCAVLTVLLALLDQQVAFIVAAHYEAVIPFGMVFAGIGVGLTIYADRMARFSRILFAALGALSLLAAIGLSRFDANHSFLTDTWFQVGIYHAIGLCTVLWALAVVTAWAAKRGRQPSLLISAILGLAIFAAGLAMLRPTLQIGLQGMPRRYVDYPDAFALGQASITFWSVVLAALILIAAIRTVHLARSDRPSPAGAFE